MPIKIITDWIKSNVQIHIDAQSGIDIVDPQNDLNIHHFNQGDVMPANSVINFQNNGQYQNIHEANVAALNNTITISIAQPLRIKQIHFNHNGVNFLNSSDLMNLVIFAPNTQMCFVPDGGLNDSMNVHYDQLGFRIDETTYRVMGEHNPDDENN